MRFHGVSERTVEKVTHAQFQKQGEAFFCHVAVVVYFYLSLSLIVVKFSGLVFKTYKDVFRGYF